MINITDEQMKILKSSISNLDELLKSENVDSLLLNIDDLIIYNLDENDEPDELGRQLQQIYDEIFIQNQK